MADCILLETVDKLLLENGTGCILLEGQALVARAGQVNTFVHGTNISTMTHATDISTTVNMTEVNIKA